MLADRGLNGAVIPLDAGLTHPVLARQTLAQDGHYFMVVKRNQARLYQELTWYFDTPPLPCDRPWHTHHHEQRAWALGTMDPNLYRCLPALRNAIINRFRAGGWTNMTAALRHYANTLPEVFHSSVYLLADFDEALGA